MTSGNDRSPQPERPSTTADGPPPGLDVQAFATAFQKFLATMDSVADTAVKAQFVDDLRGFLGTDPRELDPTTQEFPSWRWPDVDVALESLADDQNIRGIGPVDDLSGIAEVLANRYGGIEFSAIERRAVECGPGKVRHVITNGLRCLRIDGSPVVVLAVESTSSSGLSVIRVNVLSADPGLSRRVLARVSNTVRENSVMRGQIISFAGNEFGEESVAIEFHPRPSVERGDLVLPEGVLDRIEATVLGMGRQSTQLRALGQHLSRGILLYGPPGTGKTMTIRHLLTQASDYTVFLLQGEGLSRIRTAANAARTVGSTIIVLEDADLVAADRDFDEGNRSVLFDVLDILDGLDDDADIAFVLTTNRVGVLEEALALRPGRIDLAVEVPLPTEELRRRLFAGYARELAVTADGAARAAAVSEGTTGSFPKEAVRRAVLDALARGDEVDDDLLVMTVENLVAEAAVLREAMDRDSVAEAGIVDDDWDEKGDDVDGADFGGLFGRGTGVGFASPSTHSLGSGRKGADDGGGEDDEDDFMDFDDEGLDHDFDD